MYILLGNPEKLYGRKWSKQQQKRIRLQSIIKHFARRWILPSKGKLQIFLKHYFTLGLKERILNEITDAFNGSAKSEASSFFSSSSYSFVAAEGTLSSRPGTLRLIRFILSFLDNYLFP